jgi:aspartate racemase
MGRKAAKDRRMKRIGILGGMGPESTVTYYQHIVRIYHERFHDYDFPEMIIFSVSFQRFIDLFEAGQWHEVARETVQGLDHLHRAGADFAILASNTLHIAFEKIEQQASLPLVGMMEPVVEAIRADRLNTVGLLGTAFTMRADLYRDRLLRDGIQTLLPDQRDQERLHEIIASELTVGVTKRESKEFFLRVMDGLRQRGAQGIILGCTEIPLLVAPHECDLRLFDTVRLHAQRALDHALA